MSIERWPKSSSMNCGCRVALIAEGKGDIVMYFPCSPDCPTLDITKAECEKVGVEWESRNVNNN